MKSSSIGALVIVAIVIGSLLNLVALCVQTRFIASVPFSATSTIYEQSFGEFKKQKLTNSKIPSKSLQKTEIKKLNWIKNNLQETKRVNYSYKKVSGGYFVSKQEKMTIHDGILTISENEKNMWSSNEAWWVDSYSIADVDGDGKNDLALSVWKSGNFGSSKPFWIKENDPAVKNHFFVFSFKDNRVVPLWQSSNLTVPNCEFLLSDLDGDKIMELVVLEGTYNDNQTCKSNYLAVWQWNGWGFSNEYRSEVGVFKNLELGKRGGGKVVRVEIEK